MFKYIQDGILVVAHKSSAIESAEEFYEGHMHDMFELLYFVKGDVEYTVEQSTRHLEPGDFVLIAPGKYHHARVNPNVEYERYVILFPATKGFKDICDVLLEKEPFFTNCQKTGLLTSYLDDYYENFDGVVRDCLLKSELLKIMSLLCYNAENKPQVGDKLIDEAIKYINLHLQEPIYLDEIAKHCKISKVSLSIEFKNALGITIMHYVAAKRAIATKEAINHGMKKGEAAKKFGYQDYSTFYRGYQKLKILDPNAMYYKLL